MPSEYIKILKSNKYQKSDKTPFIIKADLKCIRQKINECKINIGNSSLTKVREHIPSDFSMSTISSFRRSENTYDVYRV